MITVDAVILPPLEMTEKALELNRKLVSMGNNEIVLDAGKCIPHITLAMGCVYEKDLNEVKTILSDIAKSYPPVGLKSVPSKGGKAEIRIQKERDIELLHEIVMIRLKPFFSYNAAKEMIYSDKNEKISDITLDYIRGFFTDSSFENYEPHITVGRDNMDLEVGLFEFSVDNLALCQLGDFCTCRKILWQHRLAGQKSH